MHICCPGACVEAGHPITEGICKKEGTCAKTTEHCKDCGQDSDYCLMSNWGNKASCGLKFRFCRQNNAKGDVMRQCCPYTCKDDLKYRTSRRRLPTVPCTTTTTTKPGDIVKDCFVNSDECLKNQFNIADTIGLLERRRAATSTLSDGTQLEASVQPKEGEVDASLITCENFKDQGFCTENSGDHKAKDMLECCPAMCNAQETDISKAPCNYPSGSCGETDKKCDNCTDYSDTCLRKKLGNNAETCQSSVSKCTDADEDIRQKMLDCCPATCASSGQNLSTAYCNNPTEEEEDEGGRCTIDDRDKIWALGSGPDSKKGTYAWLSNKCGRANYDFFANSFNMDGFVFCIKNGQEGVKMDVTTGCGRCIGYPVFYGTQNCKSQCMTNTCAGGCVSCNQKGIEALEPCTGWPMPAKTCGEEPPPDPVWNDTDSR